MKNKSKEIKRFSKKAILLASKGVKKDVLKFILKEDELYSLEEVEVAYKEFLEGGKK